MSDANEVRDDRRYTKDHEWALREGNAVRVGITAFAVGQLGDVTLVSIDLKAGDPVRAGQVFGTIESVKTLSDLYSPVNGRVGEVNAELENKPELVNEDCYGRGWMIVLETDDAGDSELLDANAYREHAAQSDH